MKTSKIIFAAIELVLMLIADVATIIMIVVSPLWQKDIPFAIFLSLMLILAFGAFDYLIISIIRNDLYEETR